MIPTKKGFAFDDVLLVPKKTYVTSRSEVSIESMLVRGVTINTPILSANTTWCTESAMATAMAAAGGLGVIHRMCSISYQSEEIRKVKNNKTVSTENSLRDKRGRLLVAAAIGTNHDYAERSVSLVEAGADILVIDIAHGHSQQAIDVLKELKQRFPDIQFIAGNVATADATRELIEAGADAIKVGIGPGSVCTTRIVTGAGVPQVTAIHECAAAARPYGIPTIADGGIKTWGDIAKAIAAGADTVMLGGMLAGTTESAASLVEKNGQKFKVSDGFSTLGMKHYREVKSNVQADRKKPDNYASEGIEMVTPYIGDVTPLINEASAALRSAFSYSGARSLSEFHSRAEFIEITPSGYQESKPHIYDRHFNTYQKSDYKDGIYRNIQ
ncbi:IMP dehydrogenase [Gynuella sp.]|uniref:IMP dehydrogenase n=1 Tax=Gynuella sp. TaxID=2969146 RepID=UPI003D0F41B6